MATNDYTLEKEARTQTRLGDAVLPSSDVRTLIGRAKREVEAEAGTSISDWYGDTNAERALFWQLCIFMVGEVGSSDGFTIGDLKLDPAGEGDDLATWQTRVERAVAAIRGGSAKAMGGVRIQRQNREYGE